MTSRLQFLLLQLSRKLWFRASLFSASAVATALVAALASPYIPHELSAMIGANAVDNLLGILASSMLAVTIFSLSTMVSAYAAATSSVTPRATQLLLEDATTHNTLATFIGSFLFSLVGIIALSTGYYGERGRLVLFVVTIVVIVVIVATLLRWIDHVSRLGRVGETTSRVEDATVDAMRNRRDRPYLGGQPLHDPVHGIPTDARALYARSIGYVQHIDLGALQDLTGSAGGELFVAVLPGAFVDPSRALAWALGPPGEDVDDAVREAFTIADTRSFDQDPRFGASVLAEIASRALSPAVNDAGTAIDVIGRAVRVLAIWAEPGKERSEQPAAAEISCPAVHVPGISVDELFDDLFNPIARDGAAMVEVGIRLQKALRALAQFDDPRYLAAARKHSQRACERSMAALTMDHDKQLIRTLAAEIAAFPQPAVS